MHGRNCVLPPPPPTPPPPPLEPPLPASCLSPVTSSAGGIAHNHKPATSVDGDNTSAVCQSPSSIVGAAAISSKVDNLINRYYAANVFRKLENNADLSRTASFRSRRSGTRSSKNVDRSSIRTLGRCCMRYEDNFDVLQQQRHSHGRPSPTSPSPTTYGWPEDFLQGKVY